MYCVYSHSHNGEIFYIGHGSMRRPYVGSCTSLHHGPKWNKKVSQLSNYDINIIETFDSKYEAIGKEAELINEIKPECNMVLNGYRISDSQKSAISNSLIGNTHTLGMKHSEECKEKHRNQPSCKPVLCSNGITYKSCADAERELKLNRNCVSSVARGKSPSTGGYKFSFANGGT